VLLSLLLRFPLSLLKKRIVKLTVKKTTVWADVDVWSLIIQRLQKDRARRRAGRARPRVKRNIENM